MRTEKVISRFSRRITLICLGFTLVLGSLEALAEPITFAFTGELTNDSILGSAGDVVSGTYTFESTTPDTAPFPGSGIYPGALLDYAVTIGARTFTLDPSNTRPFQPNQISVSDGPQDAYTVGAPLNDGFGLSELFASVGLTGPGTIFTSDALPLQPPDVSLFTVQQFAFVGGLVDSTGLSFSALLRIDSITLVSDPGLTCNLQLNQLSYLDGDTVILEVFGLANPGLDSVAVEWKVWLRSVLDSFSLINVGADGTFVLPPGFEQDFGPADLFLVTSEFSRGDYSLGCRMLDPVTGELLAERLVPFTVE